MNYNYHTHTRRCGHASGTEREYIENAIAGGIKTLGFSDHIFFRHDEDGFEAGYRVPVDMVEDYFTTLRELRDEYADKIDIKIGFETEYFPRYYDKMVRDAVNAGAEYLILGEHYLDDDRPNSGSVCSFDETTDERALITYVDRVTAAVESGYISIVAHPDFFHYVGDGDIFVKHTSRFIKACKAMDVPLEINCLGIRGKRHYPNPLFWQEVGRIGAPVVLGSDAHDAFTVYDAPSVAVAKAMIEKYGLNYQKSPKLKILTNKF